MWNNLVCSDNYLNDESNGVHLVKGEFDLFSYAEYSLDEECALNFILRHICSP